MPLELEGSRERRPARNILGRFSRPSVHLPAFLRPRPAAPHFCVRKIGSREIISS